MEENRDVFIERLAARIEGMGLTKAEAARRSGLNVRAVFDILQRRSNPRLSTVRALASGLGVSVAYLIGETNDPSPTLLSVAHDGIPLTVSEAAMARTTTTGDVLVDIPTHEAATVGFLFTGPQALHLAKYLERAEERLNAEHGPGVAFKPKDSPDVPG